MPCKNCCSCSSFIICRYAPSFKPMMVASDSERCLNARSLVSALPCGPIDVFKRLSDLRTLWHAGQMNENTLKTGVWLIWPAFLSLSRFGIFAKSFDELARHRLTDQKKLNRFPIREK